MSHPPPYARPQNEECKMHSKQKQTLQQKSKHMIIAQNAEYQASPVALRPDSDSSIQNQNGMTGLVGSTGPVSSPSPRGEGTGEGAIFANPKCTTQPRPLFLQSKIQNP